mmetsp:Transcript_12923/g.47266  ORF Transcript_12923/g.47266 Transcript_12923/m.47266 type:complete len:210 (-) Transcript_12923:2582-3211(-)
MAAAMLKANCTLKCSKGVVAARVGRSSPTLPLRRVTNRSQKLNVGGARRQTVTAALPVDAILDAHSSLSHISSFSLADLNPLQVEYWYAFVQWRTQSPWLLAGTVFLPIAVTFVYVKNGIQEKSEKFRQQIKDGGYDDFLLENELDVELMGIKELRYFVRLMEAGKLDEQAIKKYNNYFIELERWNSPIIELREDEAPSALTESKVKQE